MALLSPDLKNIVVTRRSRLCFGKGLSERERERKKQVALVRFFRDGERELLWKRSSERQREVEVEVTTKTQSSSAPGTFAMEEWIGAQLDFPLQLFLWLSLISG